MHNIIDWGKAMYWGTSEWAAAEIAQAFEIAERHHLHKPTMEQPQYNLFERGRFEADYVRVYEQYGLGATTWSPLASGMLSGKYNDGIPPDSRGGLPGYDWIHKELTDAARISKVRALAPLAKELNCTLSQLAIAWCLKNRFVSTVITGASRVAQVQENMKAGELAERLTPDVLQRIDRIFAIEAEADQ